MSQPFHPKRSADARNSCAHPARVTPRMIQAAGEPDPLLLAHDACAWRYVGKGSADDPLNGVLDPRRHERKGPNRRAGLVRLVILGVA